MRRTNSSTGINGFTLVELLVVIGIIGLLISILLPVMGKVRESSRRTACQAQLRDIGNQFQMYLNENKQRLPRINPDGMKYNTPNDIVPGALPMALLLKPYNGGAYKVFWCPSDYMANPETTLETDEDDLTVNGIKISRDDIDTWYERLGSSYEYNGQFNTFAELDDERHLMQTWPARLGTLTTDRRKPSQIWVFRDCDVFHGKKGEETSRNYLFADFHVADRRKS
jgi:prepilin-type N-terminal cleavage/methylation domain-containing protein/prepilin-type processing-associated H-X9-DG protein